MVLAFPMMHALLLAFLARSEEASAPDSATCLLQLRADLGGAAASGSAQPEGTGEKHALQEKTDPRVFEKLTDPTDEHPPATDEEAKEEGEMEAAEDAEHHHQELEEAELEVEEREHKPHGKKHGHTPAEDHELEEHGEHGEHGAHGAHHHGEGILGRQIGLMLVGAVTFQMALFYLVNNRDPDIRRYSWYTIGTTISMPADR